MCQSRSKCQRHINHTNPLFLNHISVSGVDLAARRPHIPEHHDGEDLEEHGRRRIRRWESSGEAFFPLINFDISKLQLHNTTNFFFQKKDTNNIHNLHASGIMQPSLRFFITYQQGIKPSLYITSYI